MRVSGAAADPQGYRSFWNHTVQPESGLIVNYYGLPSISMRDVWFHHWARNEPGFLSRDIMCSINHPNYLGHLCACPTSPIFFAAPGPARRQAANCYRHPEATWAFMRMPSGQDKSLLCVCGHAQTSCNSNSAACMPTLFFLLSPLASHLKPTPSFE